MHKNTQELHQLMEQHQLTPNKVAELLNRKVGTVYIWRVKDTEKVIPDQTLELLKLKLAAGQQGGQPCA